MSGGFPCQDVSDAGKRAGINGSRSSLVYEQIRLLNDIKPDYAVFENVAGFRRRGLTEVLGEITKVGYDAEWYSLRASGFGASHKRERIFVVAHAVGCFDESGCSRTGEWRMENQNQSDAVASPNPTSQRVGSGTGQPRENDQIGIVLDRTETGSNGINNNSDASNTDMQGLQGRDDCQGTSRKPETGSGLRDAMSWPEVAASLCRVDARIPDRLDRFRCLGNAVVPQQVYPILKAIADIERGASHSGERE